MSALSEALEPIRTEFAAYEAFGGFVDQAHVAERIPALLAVIEAGQGHKFVDLNLDITIGPDRRGGSIDRVWGHCSCWEGVNEAGLFKDDLTLNSALAKFEAHREAAQLAALRGEL